MMGLVHIKCLMVIYFFLHWGETVKSQLIQEEEATLVVYRKPNLNFSIGFQMFLNDSVVVKQIEANSYYVIRTRPGKMLLKTQGSALRNITEKKEYSITLEAGKTYYLEALQEYQWLMTTLHLVRRQEEVANEAIKKMKANLLIVTTETEKYEF